MNDNIVIKYKFFCLIRSGLGLSSSKVKLSKSECDCITSLAVRQSVLPIVYRGMKIMDAPLESILVIDRLRLKDEYQSIQHNAAINKISSVFEENNIDYILLKGAVLRFLYPDALLRSSCDIDVLVKEDDIFKAVKILEKHTDFVFVKKLYHDCSLVNSHVHLELHFSIKENMENIDSVLSQVWDYSSRLNNSFQFVMSPEFQIFHVVAHMSYHMLHGGIGVRPFIDLWFLRNQTNYSEKNLRDLLHKSGILLFYEKCCQISNCWMTGVNIPDDLKLFEDYCLAGGVFGTKRNESASKMRHKQGVLYFFSRVFLNKKELAISFPEIETKPYLFAVYQVRRWLHILNIHNRKNLLREINSINSAKRDEIDSYNELLKSLGL